MQIPPGEFRCFKRHVSSAELTSIDSHWIVSPYVFMIATLLDGPHSENVVPGKSIIGQSSSSLHRLKDNDNRGA